VTEQDPRESLRDLEKGLERARRDRLRDSGRPTRDGGAIQSRGALGLAFRISLELVVAVVVCVGIGWALDRWLGTRPWGTIVFFFLGVAAGLVNVYRAIAGMGPGIGYRRRGQPHDSSKEEDED
jgi:ATP synthase protein I